MKQIRSIAVAAIYFTHYSYTEGTLVYTRILYSGTEAGAANDRRYL